MTSKTYYQTVPYEKEVTINRAPTDESVKLFNEFMEKARENILNQGKLENNVLKAHFISFSEQLDAWNVHFYIQFQLNGKEHTIHEAISKDEWNREVDKQYCAGIGNTFVFRAIYKKISELIATELIKQVPEFTEEMSKKLGL